MYPNFNKSAKAEVLILNVLVPASIIKMNLSFCIQRAL